MTDQSSTWRQLAHSRLVILQVVSVAPLAYLLPFSRLILVATVALLVALSAFFVALISSRMEMFVFQAAHLLVAATCLSLALQPALRPSGVDASLLIGLSCVIVMIAGLLRLPSGVTRLAYFVQQTALILLLHSWILIEPIRPALLREGIHSDDSARMGMTFLFAGPMAMVSFIYLLRTPRWARYWPAAVGFCVASYGMGLFHVGDEMGSRLLLRVGTALIWTLLPLLVLALITGRRTSVHASELKRV